MNNRDPFDDAVRAKLRDYPAPPGLRTRLLAQHAAPARVSFWQRPAFRTLATAAVILALAVIWILPDRSFDSFRAEMVRYVSKDYRIEVAAATFADLQQAFAAAGWPADYRVPADLQTAHIEGGCLLTWRGQKISQLCLEQDNRHVWLFIAAPDAFDHLVSSATIAGFPTAAWRDDRAIYLLIRAR